MIYRLSDQYKGFERLTTIIDGTSVNLTGKDYIDTVIKPAGCCGNQKDVKEDRIIKGATQAQLKKYYDEVQKGQDGKIILVKNAVKRSDSGK